MNNFKYWNAIVMNIVYNLIRWIYSKYVIILFIGTYCTLPKKVHSPMIPEKPNEPKTQKGKHTCKSKKQPNEARRVLLLLLQTKKKTSSILDKNLINTWFFGHYINLSDHWILLFMLHKYISNWQEYAIEKHIQNGRAQKTFSLGP